MVALMSASSSISSLHSSYTQIIEAWLLLFAGKHCGLKHYVLQVLHGVKEMFRGVHVP